MKQVTAAPSMDVANSIVASGVVYDPSAGPRTMAMSGAAASETSGVVAGDSRPASLRPVTVKISGEPMVIPVNVDCWLDPASSWHVPPSRQTR